VLNRKFTTFNSRTNHSRDVGYNILITLLKMTFKEAKLLDILLKDFMIPEYVGNGSFVAITSVTQGNKKLNKLSELEVKQLIQFIKTEFIKTGIPLLSNDSFAFVVFLDNIKLFLKNGGFKRIFILNILRRFFLYIIPLITFGILFWSEFIKDLNQKEKTEIEENTIQKENQLKDTIQTKKLDLKNLNVKGNREHNLKTTTKEN
jgi:hypothetical protein